MAENAKTEAKAEGKPEVKADAKPAAAAPTPAPKPPAAKAEGGRETEPVKPPPSPETPPSAGSGGKGTDRPVDPGPSAPVNPAKEPQEHPDTPSSINEMDEHRKAVDDPGQNPVRQVDTASAARGGGGEEKPAEKTAGKAENRAAGASSGSGSSGAGKSSKGKGWSPSGPLAALQDEVRLMFRDATPVVLADRLAVHRPDKLVVVPFKGRDLSVMAERDALIAEARRAMGA